MNAIDCDLSTGRCPTCGNEGKPHYNRNCPVKMGRVGGAGTELTAIFKALSIEPVAGCECDRIAAWMDQLGPAGCREHRGELLEALRANYDLYGLADKLRAGIIALSKGMPLSLEGLFELAIERAEEKAANRTSPP